MQARERQRAKPSERTAAALMRREQVDRLLDVAFQLWARKRAAEAVWCGKLAHHLDPASAKASAYLRLMGSDERLSLA